MNQLDLLRLAELEASIGSKLPGMFREFLTEHVPVDDDEVGVKQDSDVYEIRTTYRLDDGPDYLQLDGVYARVGAVLPKGAVPFAQDWGGNFYCLMLSGKFENMVVYWDHERDAGDHSIEPLHMSFREFVSGIEPLEE